MIKFMKAATALMLLMAMAFAEGCTKEYSVGVSANPSAGGTVNGGGLYVQGESCTVTAKANDGYSFVNWTENGNEVSTNANYTFNITGNRTLVANFTQLIYTINVSAVPDVAGTVTGGGDFHYLDECTIEAIVSDGFVFYYWSEDNEWVSSNSTYTFSVDRDRSIVAHFAISSGDGHAYVDLGLPSGTLWATCNVGANAPEEYGDFFAWGETQPKDYYDWSTYQYCNGGNGWNTLTKYCNNFSYGYNGFTDDLTNLLPEDDAATANWGDGWCMPTVDQWMELDQNTTCILVTQNGVNGTLFIGFNGNRLFLPAAGFRKRELVELNDVQYWSNSLNIPDPNPDLTCSYAWIYSYSQGGGKRVYGRPVRSVRSSNQN